MSLPPVFFWAGLLSVRFRLADDDAADGIGAVVGRSLEAREHFDAQQGCRGDLLQRLQVGTAYAIDEQHRRVIQQDAASAAA